MYPRGDTSGSPEGRGGREEESQEDQLRNHRFLSREDTCI